MKKVLFLLAFITLAASCTDYQDEIDALDYRITVLENLVKQWNRDLESTQVLVEAMENSDYITSVTQNSEGYIITFHNSGAIVIKDGVDGKDGKDGADGKDGESIHYIEYGGVEYSLMAEDRGHNGIAHKTHIAEDQRKADGTLNPLILYQITGQ